MKKKIFNIMLLTFALSSCTSNEATTDTTTTDTNPVENTETENETTENEVTENETTEDSGEIKSYEFPEKYWQILDYMATEVSYFDENNMLIADTLALGEYMPEIMDNNSAVYEIPVSEALDMSEQIEASILDYIETLKTEYKTFTDVTANEDYTDFNFFVDDSFSYALFVEFESFILNSVCYQIYTDVPLDEITSNLVIIDNNSGEIINTFSYENFFTTVSYPYELLEYFSSDLSLFETYNIDVAYNDTTFDITLPRTFSFFIGELYKYQLDNAKSTMQNLTELSNLYSIEVNDTYTELNIYIDNAFYDETIPYVYPSLYAAIYGYYTYNELDINEVDIIFNTYDYGTDELVESIKLEDLYDKISTFTY
ncbi:MAG: hypothetical protein ACK5LY_04645 [Lachnospirales bacterium]